MTLHTRIAVWFVVSMAILFFALAFTTQRLMVTNLRAELDERLQLQAELVATAILSSDGVLTSDYTQIVNQVSEQQLVSIPIVIRITDLNGDVKAAFGSVPGCVAPALNRLLSLHDTDKGRFDNIAVHGIDKMRVYTVQLRDSSTSKIFGFIQTAGSLASVTAAERRLWLYTVIEGILGSLLSVVVGLTILRQGLRPLDRILNRIQEIDDRDLTSGLPDESRPPELQRLADNLNSMWRRLDAALKAKDTFLASVSHELRTPLTAIQGHIDFLRKQPLGDPELKDSLERIAREVRRLVRVTNNLLLSAQLDTKPSLERQIVNLRELVEDVVKEMRILAEGRALTLEEGEDVLISGDRDLLKQALVNIIDNAIKFTPRNGLIQLTLEQEDKRAVLEVSDTGCGISPKHLPYVTERFYRARESGQGVRGAGLGLAITKQIVELHNGEVKIASQEGIGTKVWIYLPI